MTVAFSQPIPAPGSTPLIQGYPTVMEGTEWYLDDFNLILSHAVAEAERFARDDLRKTAKSMEGWREIAEYLDVAFDGEGFTYYAHEPAMEEANRLEYGDANSAPSSLFRKKALAHAPEIGAIISDMISQEFPSGS